MRDKFPAMYNLILSNGLIYDGLCNKPFYADIGIAGDKISVIGRLDTALGGKIINLQGLCVCPGFIDMHSHSDVNYFLDPYAECKIRQGVTTEVIGNCGGSAAPLYGEFRERRKKEWEPLGIKIKWQTFGGYINTLRDRGTALNVVPLVGHGNIRGAIKGYSTSPLTKREMLKMQKLLADSMENGTYGFTSGLIYIPGMYADTMELIELLKIVREYNGIYTTHIRSEGDKLIEAIEEAVITAEKAGISLQISHLKTSGRKNWVRINELFRIIESAIRRGANVSCDRYPYIASNTDLDVLLPDWFHKMSFADKRKWINNRQDELAGILKQGLEKKWEERIMIGNACKNKKDSRYKWAEGKYLDSVSKRLMISPEKTVLELLRHADFQVQAMFFTMNENNLLKILKKPYVMIGSDSSLRALNGALRTGHPHPRVFGTFPRILHRYTGRGRLSIQQAIHKMTAMPADKLGIKDRGRIKKGAFADLVVFNPDKIRDTATYEKPFQHPEGIRLVVVNGKIVLNNNTLSGALPGKVLVKKL